MKYGNYSIYLLHNIIGILLKNKESIKNIPYDYIIEITSKEPLLIKYYDNYINMIATTKNKDHIERFKYLKPLIKFVSILGHYKKTVMYENYDNEINDIFVTEHDTTDLYVSLGIAFNNFSHIYKDYLKEYENDRHDCMLW